MIAGQAPQAARRQEGRATVWELISSTQLLWEPAVNSAVGIQVAYRHSQPQNEFFRCLHQPQHCKVGYPVLLWSGVTRSCRSRMIRNDHRELGVLVLPCLTSTARLTSAALK